jgi:MoaA/NifB/PqqE/SkfB family radical SAM enzyme
VDGLSVRSGSLAATPRATTGSGPACWAPWTKLVLYPDGSVRPCCSSNLVLGNVADRALLDIWFGAERADLCDAVSRHDLTMGCDACAVELSVEGRASSYAATFDVLVSPADPPTARSWPRSMYLNLSNACNLQCVQCDGELSSSIRRHREHLPALPRRYTSEVLDQLRDFLPHLVELEIAGGEPLLAPETEHVVELLEATGSAARCRLITNGTQYGPRVAALLERRPFDLTVSVDGATAATFESIRVGARFDAVMDHLDRFVDYSRRHGTRIEISHCLMPANVAEFPQLLQLAERRGIVVAVSVVRNPPQHSLAHLPPEELARHLELLEAADDEVQRSLELNLATWRTELQRLRDWVGAGGAATTDRDRHRIMWFLPFGSGPRDDRTERRELEQEALDGAVLGLEVGPGQVVTWCSTDLAAAVPGAAQLVGSHVRGLVDPLARRFGPLASAGGIEVTSEATDRVDQRLTFASATLRLVCVPLRDATGRAERASVLLARIA